MRKTPEADPNRWDSDVATRDFGKYARNIRRLKFLVILAASALNGQLIRGLMRLPGAISQSPTQNRHSPGRFA